jgi:hypothetical protein
MTAYADYTDLRIAVAEQVGNREISDVMDRFTKSAEAMFNRDLRLREMLTVVNVTFTAGVAALPVDFIEVSKLDDAYGTSLPESNRALTSRSNYRVDANGLFIRDLNGTRAMEYYAKIPTLTANLTTSNWLLQKSPELYLNAVSMQAAKWLKDTELLSAMSALVQSEISSLNWADARGRFGSSVVTTARYGI